MHNRIHYALSGAALFLASTFCAAGSLFDANADPDMAGGGVIGGSLSAANDFYLTESASLTSVRFWTLESSASVWDGLLVYVLYADDGTGKPTNTVLTGGNVGSSASKVATGEQLVIPGATANPYDQYVYDLDLITPYTLAANQRYWLGLYLGSGSSGIRWQYTSTGYGERPWVNNVNDSDPWFAQFSQETAFELNPAPAPVPATALLMLFGLPLASAMRWRRENRHAARPLGSR